MVNYTITVDIDVDEGDTKRAKDKAIDLISHGKYKSINIKEKVVDTIYKSTFKPKKNKGGK